MKNSKKGLTMKKLLVPITAIGLMITGCEIDESLNDNPNEITLSDVDARLFLNGAQLANTVVQLSHLNRISGMYSGQLVGFTSLYSNIYGYSLSTFESNGEWFSAYSGVLTNTFLSKSTVCGHRASTRATRTCRRPTRLRSVPSKRSTLPTYLHGKTMVG